MKIVKLEADNIKRLTAVSITPDGSMVVIGGKNEAGKSSVLDSIQYALAGGDCLPPMPIHRGKPRGQVVIDLGNLIVKRVFTAAGSRLEVGTKDGATYKSPQQILDKLVGSLSFDPLEFSRMKGKDQLETLRQLVGINFSENDAKRKRLYDERAIANRDMKNLEAKLGPEIEDPGEAVSIVDLSNALQERMNQNEANKKTRERLQKAGEAIENNQSSIKALEVQIERLNSKILEVQGQIRLVKETEKLNRESKASLEAEVAAMQDLPLEEIQEKIRNAEGHNSKVRAKKERDERYQEFLKAAGRAQDLTNEIGCLDAEKEKIISETKFPVPGLGFGDDGVTVDGIPFSQCSSAQQLRVSVAMGLALNPTLKVLLIRDGSLLDENNLSLIAKMSEEAGGQVWIEKVTGDPSQCQVFIEEGQVRNGKAVKEAA